MSNIENQIESVENALMEQFMMESMSSFCYVPIHKLSESLNIARIQQQYEHFCKQSKANLVIDRIQSGPDTAIVSLIKDSIRNYIVDEKNRQNAFMRWLYDSDDDQIISQQIKMLTKGLIYKGYKDVSEADKRMSLDPEQVSTTISIIVYFVIIANPHYSADDFNKLFVETWFDYYENWMATELMFQMNGDAWREQFKGVLLFDK